ncbi:MAG: RNA methyltransferase [Ignavibacteria bacterium]
MTNSELKYYEKLKFKKYRNEENKFLIEGVHLIEECLRSSLYNGQTEKVFVREGSKNEELISNINAVIPFIDIFYLDSKKFNKLSETENSQGIIASVNKIPDNFPLRSEHQNLKSNIVIALDHINDPGNLGTIIRTCYWFDVKNIIVSEGSADIYNSKTLRSSQGALFNVNIVNEADLADELKRHDENNFKIILADLDSDKHLSEFVFDRNVNYVLVLGSESNGISNEILSVKNYSKLKIKGFSDCESLNVGISLGIILYAAKKTI